MTVCKSVSELIGGTPLVELTNYEKNNNLEAVIVGKVESFNPAGSVKDRVAKAMIDDALASGKIDADTVLIEPHVGQQHRHRPARHRRCTRHAPDHRHARDDVRRAPQPHEEAYGAELVLTDGALGMKGAIARADELAAEIPNSFIVGQFTNPANPAVHEATTGPEIWEATGRRRGHLRGGRGHGGTVICRRVPQAHEPDVQVVAVEPPRRRCCPRARARTRSRASAQASCPTRWTPQCTDEVIAVADEDAFAVGRELAKEVVGISSGAAVATRHSAGAPSREQRARPSNKSSPTTRASAS